MLHYASGAPANDDFQVVENQLARQRLFSVHPTHSKPLRRWVDDLHSGIHSFRDQLKLTPSLSGKLARADVRMRAELAERGHDPLVWVSYENALLALSDRLGPGYPRRIMLDSGAFTDWNKGRSSAVSDVVRSYQDFLDHAGDLFDEVFLINLDAIPDVDASDDVKAAKIKESDENFAVLKAAFPNNRVLPVFHQGEAISRLDEVVAMADEYVCLSPNNKEPEKAREMWTLFHNLAAQDTNCHGLATTGNGMMRVSGLYSGDSTSWKTHGGNGAIDIRFDVAWDGLQETASALPAYRNVHVSIERNGFDGKRKLPNNAKHISELSSFEKTHIAQRAEQYLPFPMVQLDRRAMSIVSLGEIQSVAEAR